jgi:hypothetical protein
MPPPYDLTGRTFHDWTVVRRAGASKAKKALWLCRCRCGAESEVVASQLVRGTSRRCRKCSNASRTTFPVAVTEAEHRGLTRAALDAGTTVAELVRSALRAAGLI